MQSVPDSSLRSAVTTLQFPRKPILILAYMRVILSPPFIFSVYPFYFLRSSINPPSRPFILPVCIHSLSLCVRPSTLSLPLPSVWNLSTSGQPHLLGCPQDINRTQRLVSVYQRPLNKRIASPSFCIIRLISIGGEREDFEG